MDLWEAIWLHADAGERAKIMEGPPREYIDAQRHGYTSCPDIERRAKASYAAIMQVLKRLADNPHYHFSARAVSDDAQQAPHLRLEAGYLVAGRVSWQGPGGIRSRLLLDWTEPQELYVDIMLVESVDRDIPLAAPRRINGGRSIDDTVRLRGIERRVKEGATVEQAARDVILNDPELAGKREKEADVKRIARKYRARIRNVSISQEFS